MTDVAKPSDKQARQLKLLSELSTKLQAHMTSDNFFSQVIEIIQKKFHYYSCHIWSADENLNCVLEAQAGAYSQHIQIGHLLRRNEGIIGYVCRTRQSFLSNDVSTDKNYTNLSLPISTQSQLTVPILIDGKELAGVISVESDHKSAFAEDDISTLETVAAQVGVAIQNRKLYSEAKDFGKKLQVAVEEKTRELREAHGRILEQQKLLQRENKALKTIVDQDNKSMDLIGKSPAILSILTMVDKIAPTTATVLIQGESGTGKELIARRLHFKSDRSNKPYVTVNCGALQESLLESELFGHEKGSFTGAFEQKTGLCEVADEGTLFLDEVGELSPSIQAKLLRFLQEGEFYRIGGKKPIKVDVRIVSATNRDLELEVRENRFREDLFYRLNTITLRMPPLRKRKEDIQALVDFFLKNPRFGGTQLIKRIDPRVYEIFQNYEWPGNIRELQNMVERLKILAENNEIRMEDIPFNIRMPKARLDNPESSVETGLAEVEKNHILRTLAYHGGNKTKTAKVLGITIKTLYNKLHSYGVLSAQDSSEKTSGGVEMNP